MCNVDHYARLSHTRMAWLLPCIWRSRRDRSCLVWGSRNHVEKLGLEHSGFLVCLSHRGAKRLSRSRGAAAVKIGSRGKLWFMCRRKGITPGWKYVFAAPWSGSKWCARVRPYQSVPTVTKRIECRRDQFDKGTAVTLGLFFILNNKLLDRFGINHTY